jgi:Protein of unknown function (DUF3619)
VNTPPSNRPTEAQAQAIEARFALRVTSRLHEGADALPHDISERLRVARQQAVAAAAQARLGALVQPELAPALVLTGTALAGAGGGNASAPGHFEPPRLSPVSASQRDRHHRVSDHGKRLDDTPTSWAWRLASALPAVALVAGLWAIGAWHQREQVQAATEVDMALLTDELPPTAYADPGFEEYLRSAGAAGDAAKAKDQQAREDPTDLLPEIDTEAVVDEPSAQAAQSNAMGGNSHHTAPTGAEQP